MPRLFRRSRTEDIPRTSFVSFVVDDYAFAETCTCPACVARSSPEVRAQYRTQMDEARDRARALLLRFLDADQRTTLLGYGYFDVEPQRVHRRAPWRGTIDYIPDRFRIGRERTNNILGLDDNDAARYAYCVVFANYDPNMPIEDRMLAQKFLIETDLERFFQIAVRSRGLL